MMEKVISVENLSRTYEATVGILKKEKKTVHALKGVSFDVHKGEIFGLLGPNGAGKTTTIKILTTLLAPTSGTAKVLGHDTFGDEQRLRSKINFIFGGERSLYWRLSAYDNLRYFASLYKVPRHVQKERIPCLLKKVGLLDKQDLKVETFSKGMKQRLQIARGLINDPEILFLDEPTIGLDPSGAILFRNIVKDLAASGKTILLTTHYMHEAEELCDRVGIIADGQLLSLNTPEQLKWELSKNTLEEVYLELVGDTHAG